MGQTEFIKMHIAMRSDSALIAARRYPLALKHHDFLKQEIQNPLAMGIIHKSMSPWASLVEVVKKQTPEGSPQ